jgi:cobalt-zinc-cadmium efflux system protein
LNHSHGHNRDASSLRTAFFLNLAFTLAEFVGGIWTNSLAIVADAVHDLGDSFTLGLSWYLQRFSSRAHDSRFSYGYRRYSLLAALISAVVLIVGSITILSQAIPRLTDPQPSNAAGMLIFALAGVAINGLAALRLRGGRSMNARVVAWHLLEDVLGWIAVLVVSIVVLFTNLRFLDPLLSILITAYVLYNVGANLRKTLLLFLQGVPDEIDLPQIEQRLRAIPHVQSTHHTHVWSLDGEHHVLTTHLVVADWATRDDIIAVRCQVRELIDSLDVEHTTIEIEYAQEQCGMREG